MSKSQNEYLMNLLKENNEFAAGLVVRLEKLAKECNSRSQIASLTIVNSPDIKHTIGTDRFNSAFYNLKTSDAIGLLNDLIKLWRMCDISSDSRVKPLEEALKVFGKSFKHMIGRRLLFTLTADSLEFRCWYGIPGYITKNHFDSNAQGLLFHVRAESKLIAQYPKGLLDSETLDQAINLPNGTTIYGFRWDLTD